MSLSLLSARSGSSVLCAALLTTTLTLHANATPQNDPDRVIAWNDLGMHCIDPDFSVFSILPPFNTLNAQVVRNGQLVTNMNGLTLTYEAVADASGSINTSSIGKTNFWSHVLSLFGVALPPDTGLAGNAMPGAGNVPQPMHFDPTWNWTQAEGIPLTPIDDALGDQHYPLMRIALRDANGQLLAETTPSAPNSQEIFCARCHASGASPDAEPSAGWAFHPDPLKDDRLNILRIHDELQAGNPAYAGALATAGYDATGLFDTAVVSGTSILCSRCHGSNALPGTGLPGVSPLTVVMHGGHADALNEDQVPLGAVGTRESCYTCHPGADTKCLRGAMGKAIGPDGDLAMDCQSCHGDMTDVGDPNRVGWLEQPNCQACHTGSATLNSGEIRFTSVFDGMGNPHVPASNLFATTPDTPGPGFSLYRFSTGHGDLQCSACHGSPHAIYPTTVENDNRQNIDLQGHSGTLMECSSCHGALQDNELDDGPHGMHATTSKWVNDVHKDRAEQNLNACRACHGADLRGSVLARTQTARTYQTDLGTKNFWKGFEVSCYTCHDGPDDDDAPNNAAPSVPNLTLTTPKDVPLQIPLAGSDANGDPLTFRIVEQPAPNSVGLPLDGTVGLVGATATYIPGSRQGQAQFTYAANDGDIDSNLGTITVNVTAPNCAGTIESYGFGCEGGGTEVPRLEVSGCPEPGGTLTFTATGASPGTLAAVIRGRRRGLRVLGTGCVVRVWPVIERIPMVFVPDGSGGSVATVDYDVPLQAHGAMTFQLFVPGATNPYQGSFSNGVEVRVH